MGKINEARKAQLTEQLKNAVVEHVGTEADDYPSWDVGTYTVFVPGAIREHNMVKAEDEKGAKEKVRICLEKKIDAMSEVPIGEPVEISPDKLSVKTKGLEQVGANNG